MEGEGEWQRRKHGGSKRPSPQFLGPIAKPWLDWRKIHIGVDEKSPEIRAIEVTSSGIGDTPLLLDLLNQIDPQEKITCVTAEGAHDTRACHDSITSRGCYSGHTASQECPLTEAHNGAKRCPANV